MPTQCEMPVLDARSPVMIETIMQDYDLTLGAVAPYRADHPLLSKLNDQLLKASTGHGTIGMLLNAGQLFDEVCRPCHEVVLPAFGSSANLSGTGLRFRMADIWPERRDVADIIVDYGLRKRHVHQRPATILKFRIGEVECVRIGSCYELIANSLKRHFDRDLPIDPGREVNASGHSARVRFQKPHVSRVPSLDVRRTGTSARIVFK